MFFTHHTFKKCPYFLIMSPIRSCSSLETILRTETLTYTKYSLVGWQNYSEYDITESNNSSLDLGENLFPPHSCKKLAGRLSWKSSFLLAVKKYISLPRLGVKRFRFGLYNTPTSLDSWQCIYVTKRLHDTKYKQYPKFQGDTIWHLVMPTQRGMNLYFAVV